MLLSQVHNSTASYECLCKKQRLVNKSKIAVKKQQQDAAQAYPVHTGDDLKMFAVQESPRARALPLLRTEPVQLTSNVQIRL